MRSFLEPEGILLDAAREGDEVLRMFEERHYDLLFLDLHMPGRSGLEIVREIRRKEREESLPPTPIVALTGSSAVEEDIRISPEGFTEFLQKPAGKEAVLDVLARAVGQAARKSVSRPAGSIDHLVPGYLKNREDDLKVMKKALGEEDFETIESLAHKIKGTAQSYGFKTLGEACREMEVSARRRESGSIRRWMDRYETALGEALGGEDRERGKSGNLEP